ncbi:MAG TPA: hypothetical protein DET40_16380 [Lentisphaeria bacterium]|nr:MAG: hypothetical protein A2X45_01040 [Lentisphaerae bacterium GWF2_50_93]HCE45119.1 hypothetical protein [Lentisphaeria bacterium]
MLEKGITQTFLSVIGFKERHQLGGTQGSEASGKEKYAGRLPAIRYDEHHKYMKTLEKLL